VQRNHEQVVANELARREVELFFPQYVSVRQWSDRKVRLSLPLFAGYLFVRITEAANLRVLTVPRVVKLVGSPRPFPLDDDEIAALRAGLSLGRVEPHPHCTEGMGVRICRGALQGLEGVLVRKKHGFRVVVSLRQVMQSFAVEVDAGDIEPVLGE
jgi:transcription antitermination factor NusG